MRKTDFGDYTKYSLMIRKLYYPIGLNFSENLANMKTMGDSLFMILYENYGAEIPHLNLFCTGSSGAIISSIIAQKLDEKKLSYSLLHIKKDGETSHSAQVPVYSGYEFTNCLNIFVDDFISSGSTISKLHKTVVEKFPQFKLDVICVTGYVESNIIDEFKPKIIIES